MSDLPIPDPTADPALIVPPLELLPIDIQHDTDPADDHSRARHIPHAGHALLFFALAGVSIFLAAAVFLGALSAATHHTVEAVTKLYPVAANLVAIGIGYLLTLAVSILVFPLFWKQPFFAGVSWNFLAVRRYWPRILLAGLLLQAVAQAALRLVHHPVASKLDSLMTTPHGAWITALFGTLLAPFMEEMAFRGFLLPALATAYDWLLLDRTPAGIERWYASTLHSTGALVFAAVFSSIPFALLHAAQLSFAWGVVSILFGVSLVLSYLRIRLHSLAASTLLHVTYNGILFLIAGLATHGFQHLETLTR